MILADVLPAGPSSLLLLVVAGLGGRVRRV